MSRMGVKHTSARRRAQRLGRGLGLAPRALSLLACATVLALAASGAYGATVPSLVEARAERAAKPVRKGRTGLGSAAGYVWASVLDSALFGSGGTSGADGAPSAVTLPDGETVTVSGITGSSVLASSGASVAQLTAKIEQKAAENGSGQASSGSGASSGNNTGTGTGSSSGGASQGDSGNAGSGGSGSQMTEEAAKPTAAEEAQMHSWLVAKANALNGYTSRVNAAVSTYNATGDGSACDSLANELIYIRAEFGRQTFSPKSVWYSQFSNLWGAYTNLDIYVGRYGEDQSALATFNAKAAAISL